eukprot:IDg16966t1
MMRSMRREPASSDMRALPSETRAISTSNTVHRGVAAVTPPFSISVTASQHPAKVARERDAR